MTKFFIGQQVQISHTVTKQDMKKFSEISKDSNPIHFDREYVENFNLKKPIAYGMLSGAFISRVIGNHMPGKGSLWLSQTLDFVSPVYVGDELEISAKIVAIIELESVLKIETIIFRNETQIVTRGFATVKVLGGLKRGQKKENIKRKTDLKNHLSDKKNNKVAILVGASGGLGREIAKKLIKLGFNLALVYKTNDSVIKNQLSALKMNKNTAFGYKLLDINEANVSELVDQTIKKFGTVSDIIFCAAGRLNLKPINEINWEDFEEHFKLQVKLPLLLTQQVLPFYKANGRGNILFFGSEIVNSSKSKWLAYSTAKSAVVGMTKSLAKELGPFNIRVNAVNPTLVETNLTFGFSEREKNITTSERPLPKIVSAEDVANLTSFLLSEEAQNISGQIISI